MFNLHYQWASSGAPDVQAWQLRFADGALQAHALQRSRAAADVLAAEAEVLPLPEHAVQAMALPAASLQDNMAHNSETSQSDNRVECAK